ncbi:MAG TPA: hypothetical protein VF331_06280 [Polyangiales bacterium]
MGAADASACDDHDSCTQHDSCAAGICTGRRTCDAADAGEADADADAGVGDVDASGEPIGHGNDHVLKAADGCSCRAAPGSRTNTAWPYAGAGLPGR